jgi:hypothetical protein
MEYLARHQSLNFTLFSEIAQYPTRVRSNWTYANSVHLSIDSVIAISLSRNARNSRAI